MMAGACTTETQTHRNHLMNRTILNYVLDVASLLVLLVLFQTGFIMKYLLPPGSGHGPNGGPGMTILDWNRHGWGDFHWWLAVSLAGLMVLHVALHWRWVMRTTTAFLTSHGPQPAESAWQGSVVLSGVAFLLLLVSLSVGSLLWAKNSIQGECIPHDEHEGGSAIQSTAPLAFPEGDTRICGRLTLEQIERNTGVSGRVIAERLGLPDDVPTNIKMSTLAEQHGFGMPQVRDIVNSVVNE
ncbi:MAG: DUF4405 domain-containing protein [Phycisphaerae bacterium]